MAILDRMKNRYAEYRLNKINRLESAVGEENGCIQAAATSPEKIMPDKLKITLKTLPKQLSIAKGMEYTVKSLKNNPIKAKTMADDEFMGKFEKYAHSIGVDKLGFAKVPPEFIFQDKSILFENAMVLIMEMDKTAVDNAPSDETQAMGIITYDDLGKKTNELAEFLRKNGFAAHASHPAGGFVVYTGLAQKAGLGCKGRHGMLITPEFGPRQRISAIFTSIENLPVTNDSQHSWVADFCQKCGNCIKKCPGNAIIEKGSFEAGNLKTEIIRDACQGCTICMRDCSFNRREYGQITDKLDRMQAS